MKYNLVNYFGRSVEVDKVEVYLVLIRKGTTNAALCRLESLRDETLSMRFFTNVQLQSNDGALIPSRAEVKIMYQF